MIDGGLYEKLGLKAFPSKYKKENKINMQNPIRLTKVEKNILLFFVSFFKI